MVGARQLHELYGTTNRRRHFPEARWHHLVLAARNTAAAFDTLHAAGIVVGDVNQGNLLVDEQMCVRLIDCDSFQISATASTFHLPGRHAALHAAGAAIAKSCATSLRTPDHDRFGLAVLIFHLLFVGRHPFAGRFCGAGDLSIEKAIAERRFAFSKNKAATLVEPPPASLLLDDFPPALASCSSGRSAQPDGRASGPRPRRVGRAARRADQAAARPARSTRRTCTTPARAVPVVPHRRRGRPGVLRARRRLGVDDLAERLDASRRQAPAA